MKVKLVYTLLVVIIYTLVLSVFDKDNLIINYDLKKSLNQLIPEGWGFFTKSPRESHYTLYKLENNSKLKKVTIKNNSVQNYFGLSRNSRKIGAELSVLLSQVKKSSWEDCTNLNHIKANEETVMIKEPKLINLLEKGKYLIIKSEPIPWAWINRLPASDQKYQSVTIKF